MTGTPPHDTPRAGKTTGGGPSGDTARVKVVACRHTVTRHGSPGRRPMLIRHAPFPPFRTERS
jgi:hypothetical protein